MDDPEECHGEGEETQFLMFLAFLHSGNMPTMRLPGTAITVTIPAGFAAATEPTGPGS
ncbi:hypothetical protein DFQ27_000486, partial [Actinomortierella ambigua]